MAAMFQQPGHHETIMVTVFVFAQFTWKYYKGLEPKGRECDVGRIWVLYIKWKLTVGTFQCQKDTTEMMTHRM